VIYAFAPVARIANRAQIFELRLAATSERNDMVNVKFYTGLRGRTATTKHTFEMVAGKDTIPKLL
jgi:hypothetical protein